MNVLIDIVHASNIFFYKNTIERLQKFCTVIITVRQRNELADFTCKTLNIPIIVVGTHRKNFFSKIFGFTRIISLANIIKAKKIDMVTGFSNYYVSIAAKIVNVPSLLFTDNFEYSFEFWACRKFSDRLVVPECLKTDMQDIFTFKGYKELAYLYNFINNSEITSLYGVLPRKYVVLRLVAPISLDCTDDINSSLIDHLVSFLEKNSIRLLASVEQSANYPDSLKRYGTMIGITPQLHSLMYSSACVISSGDTVAREAVFLGVKSIYIGNRVMRINQELIDRKLMYHPPKEQFFNCLESVLQIESTSSTEKTDWEDTTEVVVQHILDFSAMLEHRQCL